jgi:hypothetical protein
MGADSNTVIPQNRAEMFLGRVSSLCRKLGFLTASDEQGGKRGPLVRVRPTNESVETCLSFNR